MTALKPCVSPPQLSMTLLCLHGNLIYKYTQVVERKGLEHAGGGG